MPQPEIATKNDFYPGKWIVFFMLAPLFIQTGCFSPQVDFQWGWYTRQVNGTMLYEEGNELARQGFIIVRTYYSQFVETAEAQTIYFPQARLIFPDSEGRFTIPFDWKAVRVDLTFVASGYVMNHLSIQRQVGVGDIFYEVPMQKTEGWQDHLFVTVSPFLQQFILEQDYQMAQAHQLFLGDWLSRQKEKNNPASQPPES